MNLGQCEEYDTPVIVAADSTTSTYLQITNIDSYSTYIVYVNGENEAGNGTVVEETIVTPETGTHYVSVLSNNHNSVECSQKQI